MPTLITYRPDMQEQIEALCTQCFEALGWAYEPEGPHWDLRSIPEVYLDGGNFWCMSEEGELVGIVAVKAIPSQPGAAELMRLYLLKVHHGKGYGRLLFETAQQYAKELGFKKLYADTRKDFGASKHLSQSHGFCEITPYNDNELAELYFEKVL